MTDDERKPWDDRHEAISTILAAVRLEAKRQAYEECAKIGNILAKDNCSCGDVIAEKIREAAKDLK